MRRAIDSGDTVQVTSPFVGKQSFLAENFCSKVISVSADVSPKKWLARQ